MNSYYGEWKETRNQTIKCRWVFASEILATAVEELLPPALLENWWEKFRCALIAQTRLR
jgi:hypothetical protein